MLNYSQIKLKDIAQATGYSVNTISRALRDMPDIAEETKKIITERAIKMGYVPNKTAASLRTRKSMTFGVVISGTCYPLQSNLLTELTFAASAAGYSLLFFQSHDDDALGEITAACEHGVDGMIFFASYAKVPQAAKKLVSLSLPFVLLGEKDFSEPCDTVTIDNERATFRLTQYLQQKGHRNIVYVTANGPQVHVQRRMQGFLRAMEAAGCPNPMQQVYVANNPLQHRSWMLNCTQRYPDATAFIAQNDMLALLLIDYLNRHGKHVPEDISVAGFDNILSCLYPVQLLTSVEVDLKRSAKEAIDILLRKNRGEIPLSQECHVNVESILVEGESVAALQPEGWSSAV